MSRDELWRLRAERAEATAENLRARLRSMQGEMKAPEVILWRCSGEGCNHYTFGPDWICPMHPDAPVVPVRMVQSERPIREPEPKAKAIKAVGP